MGRGPTTHAPRGIKRPCCPCGYCIASGQEPGSPGCWTERWNTALRDRRLDSTDQGRPRSYRPGCRTTSSWSRHAAQGPPPSVGNSPSVDTSGTFDCPHVLNGRSAQVPSGRSAIRTSCSELLEWVDARGVANGRGTLWSSAVGLFRDAQKRCRKRCTDGHPVGPSGCTHGSSSEEACHFSLAYRTPNRRYRRRDSQGHSGSHAAEMLGSAYGTAHAS